MRSSSPFRPRLPSVALPFVAALLVWGFLGLPALAAQEWPRADFSGWYQGVEGFRDAITLQKESGKPMFVYFYTDWCGYCAQFERVLLNEPLVIDYLDTIIKVRVNPERGRAEREIANMYQVRGFPVLVMHSGASKTMSRVPRYTERDGKARLLDAEDFVKGLKEAASL